MTDALHAGFATADITPPLGVPMMGWGTTRQRLAESVADPLELRVLWLRQHDRQIVIVCFDVCFVGRPDCQRWHGLLGRTFGLRPHQVLLAATHSHASPASGVYSDLMWEPPLYSYLLKVDTALLDACRRARDALQPVRMLAGCGATDLPMNRRQLRDGGIVNGPNPTGPTFSNLPVATFLGRDDKPVGLLFSIATHPVCFSGKAISADYPGHAARALDAHFGRPCALFLQGPAGDSRPRTLQKGDRWIAGPGAAETAATGEALVAQTLATLNDLEPHEPDLAAHLQDTRWPLAPFSDEQLQAEARSGAPLVRRWAQEQLDRRAMGVGLDAVPIMMHHLRLGPTVRLVTFEGEPCHSFGHQVTRHFVGGITFPIGYSHGEGMYLVNTEQLAEGGYESTSFREYNQAGPLAPGTETVVDRFLQTCQ